MGKDYYKTLGISRDSDEAQIKKAYKKKAMKFHPDRNLDNQEESEKMFKEVSEAYEVLSDPEKKKIYDQFGEEGLKGGMGGGPSGFGGGQYNFRPSQAEDIFKSFFGGNFADVFSTGAGFGSSRSSGMPGGFSFSSGGSNNPFGGAGGFSDFSDFGGGSNNPFGVSDNQKDASFTHTLALTLEELYSGCTKKKKITRNLYDASSGGYMPTSKILEINVKPGWKTGTKITYSEMGDERPGRTPGDLVFVVQEKPHPKFKREKNDLIVTTKITLKEALSGTSVMVDTLSRRRLRVNIKDVVTPNYSKRIAGEGMPIAKNPSQKGDLILRFEVIWPSTLTDKQKETIHDVL